MNNLLPVNERSNKQSQLLESPTKRIMDNIYNTEGKQKNRYHNAINYKDLSTILDFWVAKALAPAVIVSKNKNKIENIINAIASFTSQKEESKSDTMKIKDIKANCSSSKSSNIKCIQNVDAGTYKMMKSLYDNHDIPNLRDDILNCIGSGNDNNSPSPLVAIELKCNSTDAQLCIREMIEDTPSMTAFSTTKSALYKTGLLFLIYVEGDITPEVKSRASLII